LELKNAQLFAAELSQKLSFFEDFQVKRNFGVDSGVILASEKEFHFESDCLKLLSNSSIFTDDCQKKLHKFLPASFRLKNLQLIFTTSRDGTSMRTLLNRAEGFTHTLLVIKDSQSFVFGGFCTEEWHLDEVFYGTGETFLFSLSPKVNAYKWTHKNDYFQFCDLTSLCMGSGTRHRHSITNKINSISSSSNKSNDPSTQSHYGLWLDGDLISGTSSMSDTFFNRCLASAEEFQVVAVELWAFTTDEPN